MTNSGLLMLKQSNLKLRNCNLLIWSQLVYFFPAIVTTDDGKKEIKVLELHSKFFVQILIDLILIDFDFPLFHKRTNSSKKNPYDHPSSEANKNLYVALLNQSWRDFFCNDFLSQHWNRKKDKVSKLKTLSAISMVGCSRLPVSTLPHLLHATVSFDLMLMMRQRQY